MPHFFVKCKNEPTAGTTEHTKDTEGHGVRLFSVCLLLCPLCSLWLPRVQECSTMFRNVQLCSAAPKSAKRTHREKTRRYLCGGRRLGRGIGLTRAAAATLIDIMA